MWSTITKTAKKTVVDKIDDFNNTVEEETELDRVEKHLDGSNNIEDHIYNLWTSVVEPYLENPNRDILTDLTSEDYPKFYKFMINNSSAYQKLYDRKLQLESSDNVDLDVRRDR